MLLLLSADFFKINFSKNYFRKTIRVSNCLDSNGPKPFAKVISAASKERVNHILSSYFIVEMLLAKNEKGLAAQAMHESGNLHYHASNIRYGNQCIVKT